MNRIHIITIGVTDMNRSLRFYRDGLGFETSSTEEHPKIVFFKNKGSTLALYPKDEIAKDIDPIHPPTGFGFSGSTLAFVASSPEEVDSIIQQAKRSGGTIVKEPQKVFWGGYSGYFTDPDGYFWEVMYWDRWSINEDGSLNAP
jgi:catechol 2,3-dioxygenase-like lactoylglutathione lyase family enzyme